MYFWFDEIVCLRRPSLLPRYPPALMTVYFRKAYSLYCHDFGIWIKTEKWRQINKWKMTKLRNLFHLKVGKRNCGRNQIFRHFKPTGIIEMPFSFQKRFIFIPLSIQMTCFISLTGPIPPKNFNDLLLANAHMTMFDIQISQIHSQRHKSHNTANHINWMPKSNPNRTEEPERVNASKITVSIIHSQKRKRKSVKSLHVFECIIYMCLQYETITITIIVTVMLQIYKDVFQ